jgi:hypothetical protein
MANGLPVADQLIHSGLPFHRARDGKFYRFIICAVEIALVEILFAAQQGLRQIMMIMQSSSACWPIITSVTCPSAARIVASPVRSQISLTVTPHA